MEALHYAEVPPRCLSNFRQGLYTYNSKARTACGTFDGSVVILLRPAIRETDNKVELLISSSQLPSRTDMLRLSLETD